MSRASATVARLRSATPDEPPFAPLLVSIGQAALMLSISERTCKRLIARREIIARKIGSRTLVVRKSLESFVKRDHPTGDPR
jgi:excisionase family DNA binding protein